VAAQAHVAPGTRWERLLDLDHDLADALGDEVAVRARDRIGVATVRLEPGSWHPSALSAIGRGAFALIICDGLIVRELDLAGTRTADLLGPGDLVDLGPGTDPLLLTGERWHVSGDATVAILDDRVLPALHAWPALSSRLIARAARQASRAAEQRAISQLPRVELRIRALLWHLAERWGRIGPQRVVVSLEVTHETLGHLVGARRPTVTLALGELSREGAVTRRADGAWILRPDSNPSDAHRPAFGGPGVAVLSDTGGGAALRGLPTPPGHTERATLAHRVERLRIPTAQERARTVALLDQSRSTAEPGRDEQVKPPPR
jgi:CRP/FNR family transcriptional regulator, cyclic AMP receptor protein